MDFLKEIQESLALSQQIEPLQFVNLLRKPFTDYSKIEYDKMNNRFQSDLSNQTFDEKIVQALATISQEEAAVITAELTLAEDLLDKLKNSLKLKKLPEIRKECVSYLLRVSTPHVPELHKKLDPVLKKIEKMVPGFMHEIYETVAVLIYREIMRSIQLSDIKKTVILISKYTVLFRGDPSTPHFHEVDAFEKMFFNIIEKKNLWDNV
jgi:hypothetical protein